MNREILKIRIIFIVLVLLGIQSCAADKEPLVTKEISLKVLQFNIWQEGTVVSGGFDVIINEVIRTEADLITLSEVRNYNGSSLDKRLVEAMKAKGYVYYSKRSEDSGILSRFPIKEQCVISPLVDDHGSITKALIDVHGTEVVLYSAHLDYLNYSVYLPRGYDGLTWEELSAPITDNKLITENNLKSHRDEEIDAFILDSKIEKEKGRLIILGGDFNEASHLDWTEATKNNYDHHGVVIKWRNTLELENAGFKDAYREMFPNPATHPGFTFPADNPAVKVNQLAWAPKADERDRIDYIFYYPDSRLKIDAAKIVGPQGSVVRYQRVPETSDDIFDLPAGIWPTDHKAVLATFTLTVKQ